MFATAGVVAADTGPEIVDFTNVFVSMGSFYQPWAGFGKFAATGLYPNLAGDGRSLSSNQADPIKNILPAGSFPHFIVGQGRTVPIVQRSAAMPATSAGKTGHIHVDPEAWLGNRCPGLPGENPGAENQGTDFG